MKQLLSIKIVALLLCFFAVPNLTAQSIHDIRINEIQVYNKDGLKDDYGHPSSWIELFNTGYGKVNLSGATLKVNGKEYRIPKSNDMIIPTRGYLLFYASGESSKGQFYTNFNLEDADYITFYAPDDKFTAVDSMVINRSAMKEDVTYGWFKDHDDIEKLMNLPASTPGATNNTLEAVHRSEKFRQADPSGIVLTITAVAVVAVNLVLLYFIFVYLGKFHIKVSRRKEEQLAQAVVAAKSTTDVKVGDGVITNEELAAIAIALYRYSEDLHDIESTVLTINRAAKAYSPWSSKIYGLSQSQPRK